MSMIPELRDYIGQYKNRKLVGKVIDKFDFSTVKHVLDQLRGWWFGTEPPTEADLKEAAADVLYSAIKSEGVAAKSSGGFEAEYNKENETLSLKFVLTSSSVNLN